MPQNSCYVKLIARRKAAYKDNFLSLICNKVFILRNSRWSARLFFSLYHQHAVESTFLKIHDLLN